MWIMIALALGFAAGVFVGRRRRTWSAQTQASSFRPSGLDLSSAMERLYRDRKQLSSQVEELAAAREVSLAVGSILDFEEMIRAILNLVTSHFGVSKALIYLRSQDEEWYEIVGARSENRDVPPAKVLQKRVRVGNGLIGRAAVERREIIEAREGRGVIAAAPLITKDSVVGVLKLFDADPLILTPEKCRKLHSITGAIAVALENSRLYRLAVTDGLTGLYVHRHFQMRLKEEFTRSARYGAKLSLLMCDIDHFKKFNDTYGHQTGDMVLKGVASILSEEARGMDVVCRYGGEEMAIILPETDIAGAMKIAERIRTRIEDKIFRATEGSEGRRDLRVTVSVGVSSYAEGMKDRTDLIESADRALYEAKHAGRNQVRSGATAENKGTCHL